MGSRRASRGTLAVVALAMMAAPGRASGAPLTLTSTAFAPGAAIPARYTCDGADVSPPLAWTGVPAGTKSFALVMDDPDAPAGTWVHWVLFDVPATATSLAENVGKTARLPSGAVQGASWGVETFARTGYQGPCPPPGSPHRYRLGLYALDAMLGLAAGATKAEVLEAAVGHVVGEAELVGRYGR